LCCVVLFCVVLCCLVLYCFVLCYVVPWYDVLCIPCIKNTLAENMRVAFNFYNSGADLELFLPSVTLSVSSTFVLVQKLLDLFHAIMVMRESLGDV
jgi:hypothetical protein